MKSGELEAYSGQLKRAQIIKGPMDNILRRNNDECVE